MKSLPQGMILVGQKIDSANVVYTLAQTGADRFAFLINDGDSGELLTRFNGAESIICARYQSTTAKAGAVCAACASDPTGVCNACLFHHERERA